MGIFKSTEKIEAVRFNGTPERAEQIAHVAEAAVSLDFERVRLAKDAGEPSYRRKLRVFAHGASAYDDDDEFADVYVLRDGDWFVRSADGFQVVPDEKFQKMYEFVGYPPREGTAPDPHAVKPTYREMYDVEALPPEPSKDDGIVQPPFDPIAASIGVCGYRVGG